MIIVGKQIFQEITSKKKNSMEELRKGSCRNELELKYNFTVFGTS